MQRKKRPFRLLIVSILSLILLIYLILSHSPTSTLSLLGLHIPMLILFFFNLFFTLFLVTTYITKSYKHGILLGLFVVMALLFRINNLTHPLFLVLLVAIFLALELLLAKQEG